MRLNQRNTYDFGGVYSCLERHENLEQRIPVIYADFVIMNDAEWTFFVENLRSGDDLPQ
jgi:hypothetical protein